MGAAPRVSGLGVSGTPAVCYSDPRADRSNGWCVVRRPRFLGVAASLVLAYARHMDRALLVAGSVIVVTSWLLMAADKPDPLVLGLYVVGMLTALAGALVSLRQVIADEKG